MDDPETCAAAFSAALIGHDMRAALALLTEDVVFFYSNGTVICGKEAFSAVMTASWSRVEDYRYATLASHWLVKSEAMASLIYRFEWSGRVQGQGVGGAGRGTRVFSRDSAGWRLAHEHLSAGGWID
jgi:ketosteroid isomerase-like protein